MIKEVVLIYLLEIFVEICQIENSKSGLDGVQAAGSWPPKYTVLYTYYCRSGSQRRNGKNIGAASLCREIMGD